MKKYSVLNQHNAIKTFRGVEVQLHEFLNSPLDGGVWLASRPSRFTPRKKAPGTHWIRGLVDPRAGLEVVAKREEFLPRREPNPGRPARSLVTVMTEVSRFLCIITVDGRIDKNRVLFHYDT
jgi:hypothetical protein